MPAEQRVVLKRLELQPVPGIGLTDGTCAPYVEVIDYGHPNMPVVFTNQSTDTLRYRKGDFCVSMVLNVPVSGDVLVRVFHQNSIISIRPTPMFKIQFHTGFEKERELPFPRSELDNLGPGPLTDKRFAPNFVATLFMELPSEPAPAPRVRELPQQERAAFQTANYGSHVVSGAVPSKQDVERSHRYEPASRPPPVRDTSVKNPLASYGIDVPQRAPQQQLQRPMLAPPPVNRSSKPPNYFSPTAAQAPAPAYTSASEAVAAADMQARLQRLSMAPTSTASAPDLAHGSQQFSSPAHGLSSPMLSAPLSSPLQPPPAAYKSSPQQQQQPPAYQSSPLHQQPAYQQPATTYEQQPPPAALQEPAIDFALAEPQLDGIELQEPDFSSLGIPPPAPTGDGSDILSRLQRL
mmetsp:Transcript_17883/g.69317  ORF Transcript_17883/g.69317 Transcript_17883/m.69317 type:complete len:407 (-) Transcript_17883:9-1229(-)